MLTIEEGHRSAQLRKPRIWLAARVVPV